MLGEIGIEASGGDRETGSGDRLADSLELLADMGRDFARSLDIEVTLQSALKRITEYLGAEGGALRGESLLADVAESGEFDVAGFDEGLQSGEVGVDADVAEADKADVRGGHESLRVG